MTDASTPDTPTPSPEDIQNLQAKADALEERAQRDGLISAPAEEPEDGVGPQTGLVP